MQVGQYNRTAVVEYATKWAKGRNPAFYDFEKLGGDCTNFASQSIFAGAGVMNYSYPFGWFYTSPFKRAPSWTSVESLQNFLLRNEKSVGPFGKLDTLSNLELGDIVQVQTNGVYTHSLVITKIEGAGSKPFDFLICAHSYDALNRRLSTYNLKNAKFIKIVGVYR